MTMEMYIEMVDTHFVPHRQKSPAYIAYYLGSSKVLLIADNDIKHVLKKARPHQDRPNSKIKIVLADRK